ncbi:helix-turn-helix domain-containing protein [Leptolyngbya sp. GGD]|uniref:helix-turn-helix domain-containing protein n=1 Tax=Leptolyngbya sp. GGD TaxID=2997907 RepID=UPI00227AE48B|nr:AraC family transcriptional regulator [Leptolyngbya sp. GGD]MCY6493417.1 AraC family transcriptional regulator [Leptolyngbya sp. GGD]
MTRQDGKTALTLRGPETQATLAPCPANAEFFGIQFKLGTFMPYLPVSSLVDNATTLPAATSQSFWLNHSAWQFPNFDDADIFVDKLVREGLLVREAVVDAVLRGQRQGRLAQSTPPKESLRSIQRHFIQATGLTHRTIQQIERAQQAADLLEQGVSILDTVDQIGYADQSHLTRSLKRFIGQTPAQISRKR